MRLDRAFIDGFRNLRCVEVDFDPTRLTTVVIGQNGSGKSNLLEAIVTAFKCVDLNQGDPGFLYEIDYQIGAHGVRLTNKDGSGATVIVDGQRLSRAAFERQRSEVFPELVFGYYSGTSRRMERLFDNHQRKYYDDIKRNENAEDCRGALTERRLFYCRPIHGVLALLSFFAFPERKVLALLQARLQITGFHSALAHLRRPWFGKGTADSLWGAAGPAGACSRRLLECAFHPIKLKDTPVDDYRDRNIQEEQLAAFLRDAEALDRFARVYTDDRDLFAALEAIDISDLYRELHLWVTRVDNPSGDISFADLSDGERQLLMVLGLLRISRGKRALFLLDEPDTHLNPVWQHAYLNLIQEWTGIAGDAANCQIVMTSHNPLTISALQKEEVRIMFTGDDGRVSVSPPYTDPRGMGFTATLNEIFGLPSSLDLETQSTIDDRNALAQIDRRTADQERQLIAINDKLNRLGFLFEDREPLYQDFLRAWKDVRYADRPPLSPSEIEARHTAMKALIESLLAQNQGEPS